MKGAHGELLFGIFGSLAQHERALTRERVIAGLAAAKRRGRKGGRPPALNTERIEQIVSALDGGTSKASVPQFQGPALHAARHPGPCWLERAGEQKARMNVPSRYLSQKLRHLRHTSATA